MEHPRTQSLFGWMATGETTFHNFNSSLCVKNGRVENSYLCTKGVTTMITPGER
jgi:hypothetical protein